MDLKTWLARNEAARKARKAMRMSVPRPYEGPVGDANVAKERWDNIIQSQNTDWDAIEKEAGARWDEG